MIPAVLALLSLVVLSSSAPAADPQRPKVLAFVAGIERYADAELDKLIYAADDARDVYAQLKIVAELDDSESKLLMADDGEEGKPISDGELRNELLRFVRKLKDNSNVVVYLGGHGTLSPTKKLWYLPSNYDPAEQLNFVPFSEILTYFDDQVKAKSLSGVTVTFLVNVCGAGNAAAIADPNLRSQAVNRNQELIAEAQKLYRELRFGTMRVSVIPATPVDRNAFEDDTLKRSRFAHYLLEGMKGSAAGADGALTAGDLFAYVEKVLGEELPKNIDFKNDIVLGRTNRLEGEAHLVLGTALLGAAQAIDPADNGPDAAERASHARVLLDLAVDQLRQVEGRNPELSPRARLRLAQAALIRSDGKDRESRSDLVDEPMLSSEERSQAEDLSAQVSFPTLESFRDYIVNDDRSRVVIISEGADQEESIQVWQEAFAGLVDSGNISVTRLDRAVQRAAARLVGGPSTGFMSSDAVRWVLEETFGTLRAHDEEHRGLNRAAPLVVVYTGDAWAHPPGQEDICVLPDLEAVSCELSPIGSNLFMRIREIWGAPLAFFFDAPLGEFFRDRRPQDVPLLFAARERNGMTYFQPGARVSTSQVLARALRGGAKDPDHFESLVRFQEFGGSVISDQDFAPPAPVWIPDGPDLARIARVQIAPLKRLGLQVVAGCLRGPLTDCDEAVRIGPDRHDVLERLEAAAALDLSRRKSDAAGAYLQAEAAFGVLSPADEGGLGVQEAREVLKGLSDIVAGRARVAASKEGRRALILPVGVEDYSSPLIADVPHAETDLAAYTQALESMLMDKTTEVKVWPITTPKTAADFIETLQKASAELEVGEAGGGWAQDLLILIFSGRGAEINDHRYLVTADASGTEGAVPWKREYFVDLGDIALAVEGRWFLGIYDAQFTPPKLDPGRVDQLLDKHLDSVRPRVSQILVDGETPINVRVIQSIESRRDLPPHQVHVWIEGRLTQHPTVPHPCLENSEIPPGVASPLAAAVLSSLPPDKPGTYQDWLTSLAQSDCLKKASGAERTLVMQGDVNVPLLASGEGAELVDYLQDGIARRELNLRSALAVARDAAQRFPSARNTLAEAVLLVALAQLHSGDAVIQGFDSQRKDWGWLHNAEQLLVDINDELEEAGADLRPIQLEVLSRAHLLGKEPERAREILRQAPAQVLVHRALARRLVALTLESLRYQASEVLERVRATLARVPTAGGEQEPAAAELQALIQAERARLAEPYRISLPGSVH